MKSKDILDEKIDQAICHHIHTIFPAIAKVGLNSIDEQYFIKEKADEYTKLLKMQQFHDLDVLYYIGQVSDEKKRENFEFDSKNLLNYNPIFLKLIFSFLLSKEEKLEQKCLHIIMRIFNQREELRDNLYKVQIIFDEMKQMVFKNMKVQIQQLS